MTSPFKNALIFLSHVPFLHPFYFLFFFLLMYTQFLSYCAMFPLIQYSFLSSLKIFPDISISISIWVCPNKRWKPSANAPNTRVGAFFRRPASIICFQCQSGFRLSCWILWNSVRLSGSVQTSTSCQFQFESGQIFPHLQLRDMLCFLNYFIPQVNVSWDNPVPSQITYILVSVDNKLTKSKSVPQNLFD